MTDLTMDQASRMRELLTRFLKEFEAFARRNLKGA